MALALMGALIGGGVYCYRHYFLPSPQVAFTQPGDETLPVDDPKLRLLLDAPLEGTTRAEVGLQELPATGTVVFSTLRSSQDAVGAYEARLIYLREDGEPVKQVYFRQTDDGYLWSAEEDYHYGPHTYELMDYRNIPYECPEHLIVRYVGKRSEATAPGLTITYQGDDAMLKARTLTLADVSDVLREWRDSALSTDSE